MDKSEIYEIRKIFSKYKDDECAADHIAGCFINMEHVIKGAFADRFLSKKHNEKLKYYDLFKKILANNDEDINIGHTQTEEMCKLLQELRKSRLAPLSKPLTDTFYEKVSDALPDGNFTVFLLSYSYDVPIKTSDKRKVDDASEEVFDFIICAICPVKISKSTLGYNVDDDRIGENPQLLQVENPVFGFMYPSFNGRGTDRDSLLCFRTPDLNISEALFGSGVKDVIREAPKKKASAPSSTGISGISDERKDVFASESVPNASTKHIPSLDSGVLSNDNHTVKEILIGDEDLPFDEDGIKAADLRFSMRNASDGVPHTEQDKPKRKKAVSIAGDRNKVEKRIIDGVPYYIVPVDDTELI